MQPSFPSACWKFLEKAREDLSRKGFHTLGDGFSLLLAERLVDAFTAGSKTEIQAANDQLSRLGRTALTTAPEEARQAVLFQATPALAAAYMLGQINFAQKMAATLARRQADGRFALRLKDPRYAPILDALGTESLEHEDLLRLTGESPVKMNRKLLALRLLGIIDQHGVQMPKGRWETHYFLTPTARALMGV